MSNKLHKKKYEDIYSVDKKKGHTLHLEKISGVNMSLNEYTDLFKDLLRSFYSDLYDYYVKLAWLRRNFLYNGKAKIKYPNIGNAQYVQTSFVKYLRRIVGMDIQIITRGFSFSVAESYFDEFYPGFDEGNPFENPEYYKFPFKNISVDFLMVPFQMDERMLLLEEANNRKMSYANFLDLTVNEVLCINDDLGKDKYSINDRQHRGISFFVKNLQRIKRKKRKK